MIGHEIKKNTGAAEGIWQLGAAPSTAYPKFTVKGFVAIDGVAYEVIDEGGTDNKLKEVNGNQKFNITPIDSQKMALGETEIVSKDGITNNLTLNLVSGKYVM